MRTAKNKIEYDHKLANEIKDWWALSKESMIEKAQVDLTGIIDATSQISGQLLSGRFTKNARNLLQFAQSIHRLVVQCVNRACPSPLQRPTR